MPDNRRNLQIGQPGNVGDEAVDNNGWPTPLSDRSDQLKVVVTDGKRGTQRNFRAMSTEGQDKLSLPEGHGAVSGVKPEGMEVKIKVTEANSTKGA